jgi:triphosphoribosyl-dephospho-CoA synthase
MQAARLSVKDQEVTEWRRQHWQRLAALAAQALMTEAELTPKPGLVDQRGSGAHHDLSLALMRRSANVLEPYFATMAAVSATRNIDTDLREELAAIGRKAERAMYKATLGTNTHKGAIWTLGLLVAAAARTEQPSARRIASISGAIARIPLRAPLAPITHGDFARVHYGAAGARGEAQGGFQRVINYGLPLLRARRIAGCSEEVAQLDTLLVMMTRLEDTCVLYRGGTAALSAVQSGARAVLAAGGLGCSAGRRRLRTLDHELIARYVSPGGSADLLAATIFLDALERHPPWLAGSKSKVSHGNLEV